MFRPRPDGDKTTVAVVVEGRTIPVPAGASAAAAVLAAGLRSIRETPVEGSERAPYCMMGVCFDCLAEIDGVPNRQSCMVEVRPGMQIRRQIGARRIDCPLPFPPPQAGEG
jgi:2Fe-2S iron-sulfur cluster protein